ncbi:MAG TPA: ScyD/ScyE family protein [Candidatus Limnocylindrales bacterium]
MRALPLPSPTPGSRRRTGAALAVAFLALAVLAPSAAAETGVRVLAEGLDNPRGIAIAPTGSIWVAEAGRGGNGPCFPGPEGDDVCLGDSGAITRVFRRGGFERIVTGLPSIAAPNGSQAIGPSDVSFGTTGHLYATQGLSANPAIRAGLPDFAAATAGHLLRIHRAAHTWSSIADVAGFEAAENPDGGLPDSNPQGLLARGGGWTVADAGANALLRVSSGGSIRGLAVFPDRMADAPPFLGLPPGTQIPMQAVPTTVVRRGDSYYVGQLTGFPFPVGAASVWRVPAAGGEPEVWADGFTNIIDIALGPNGSLYVLEIAHNSLLSGDLTGALYRVDREGGKHLLLTDPLQAPGGLAVDRDGSLLVTNCGVCPGGGQLLRVTP